MGYITRRGVYEDRAPADCGDHDGPEGRAQGVPAPRMPKRYRHRTPVGASRISSMTGSGRLQVSVPPSSHTGIGTLVSRQLPDLVAPRQHAKWVDAIIQKEDDGLRTHAAVGIESDVDRYAVRFAGLHRNVLRRDSKLCI